MFSHMLALIRVRRVHVWRRPSLHGTAGNKERNKPKQEIGMRFV